MRLIYVYSFSLQILLMKISWLKNKRSRIKSFIGRIEPRKPVVKHKTRGSALIGKLDTPFETDHVPGEMSISSNFNSIAQARKYL